MGFVLVAGGVGPQAAARAHNDHPPAQPLRQIGGHAVELALVGEVDRRGEEVGLAARLRADLVVDAVPQAEDQRHLERHDGQQQHVGEREQQAEPEAYENSSGAVKRKPTPRTVCR